jgi:hypothetical protein
MVFSSFWVFAPHFQIKLSIHASNFNFRFESMSELELFLLTGVLIPNFNTMDLVKFLEKYQKLHIQIIAVTFEGYVMQNHEQKKLVKKNEKPRFYGQNKLLFKNPAL